MEYVCANPGTILAQAPRTAEAAARTRLMAKSRRYDWMVGTGKWMESS